MMMMMMRRTKGDEKKPFVFVIVVGGEEEGGIKKATQKNSDFQGQEIQRHIKKGTMEKPFLAPQDNTKL